ncbi:hypoxanthine phosphoribosyltransferase [Candidatus Frankia alpina]|uniref:tRNA(Ile)-lysidine synthase n=1 Tax=Candidatus Frankia alpina TaxID=2699483 RepID=A0A4S5ET19_9ACTN|nr:hypoxanthine phosphoribosyltransferase [Candidatus Frankia alpina]THJ75576.1 hypoxanthine phosphoribosyltransferase [Candidatus Frankia alpina]
MTRSATGGDQPGAAAGPAGTSPAQPARAGRAPDPAVAAVRLAVRNAVADLDPGELVLVACSGGPDSLSVAAALAFVAPRRALRAGLLVVDHGWDPGSAERARGVAELGRVLGLRPVEVLTAHAPRSEGAARDARRGALLAAADRLGARVVLIGHTLDDQAETVLLRLARGSGARSLGGMRPRDGLLRRPLLRLRRAQTRAACLAERLPVWDDPTNSDPVFARARVRHRVLPLLEAELGPGIAESLARGAELLRADADALDTAATDAYAVTAAVTAPGGPGSGPRTGPIAAAAADSTGGEVGFGVATLAALPAAIRGRVLRRAALDLGASASALRAEHVWAVEELVTRWRGQKPVPLPGGVLARRWADRITLTGPVAPPWPPAGPAGRGPDSAAAAYLEEDDQVSQSTTATPDAGSPQDGPPVAATHPDIDEVLVTADEIAAKIAELAARVDADYAGREILLVGVLKGAVMVMADLSRALTVPLTMEFMAVSSYGSSTSSSGVVRILKDLDRSIEGRDVLVVEDIIDSGLTLSWLLKNLRSRGPASLEVLALFRKPEAITVDVDVRYVGFDIPSAFVVGYGLDYSEYYRTLSFVGTLTPAAIERRAPA